MKHVTNVWRLGLGALLIGSGLAACSAPESSSPVISGWSTPGGDSGKTFYSPMHQINRDNVEQLGYAWEFDLEVSRGQEATPVIVGDTMVVSTNLGRVYGIDPVSGQERWRFVPEVDMQVNRTACCDQVNRGVAVKGNSVFVGTLDGNLVALDARDGRVLWQADTLAGTTDRGQNITGAPEVAGDVVIIGHGGAEYGVRGYVTAFDVDTGEQKWRFFTVPSDPADGPQHNAALEAAVPTWKGDVKWEHGLGGTVWDAIHYDPQFDVVYIGVGNGGPYHAMKRSSEGGDHLYLSSIVALKPSDGSVVWHYQTTPMDSWDFTATAPMILTELNIDGEQVPALIHAPKNGFMYVFDRRDGKLLKANAIVFQNWTKGIDPETGKAIIDFEQADYFASPKVIYPATPGARNWHPASYNPDTGLYYASVQELGNLILTTPGDKPYRAKSLGADAALVYTSDLLNILPGMPPFIGDAVKALPVYERIEKGGDNSYLRAIDPLTGETVWSVPSTSWQDRAGVLTTAGGLVFHGDASGKFTVYDAATGEELHSLQTGTTIMAAPMSYSIDGEQYIAVTAGWGGGGWPYVPRAAASYKYENNGRLLVFKLGGGAVPLPKELPAMTVAPEPPPMPEGADPANGFNLYMSSCVLCHASQQRTMAADLRRMEPITHEMFDRILLEGIYVSLGMPRWDDLFTPQDVKDIHAYLISEQQKTREHELKLQEKGLPLDAVNSGVLSSY